MEEEKKNSITKWQCYNTMTEIINYWLDISGICMFVTIHFRLDLLDADVSVLLTVRSSYCNAGNLIGN